MPYKDPERQREAGRASARRHPETRTRYRNNRDKVYFEGKKKPCADCGIEYPYYVMQYDHLPEHERLGVVYAVGVKYGLTAMKREIAKCEVVCANCHCARTWKRGRG